MEGTSFRDRLAVVTGSSKGIGRAVAERLGDRGARVAINARSEDELRKTESDLKNAGYDVCGFAVNVASEGGAEELVKAASDHFGTAVSYLVNVVAINPFYGPILDADSKRFARTMTVNTWTAVAMVQAALRHGLGEGGSVVNISTIGARQYQPGLAAYCASKAALEVITVHLANELGPRGVRVNCVSPGLVRTEMARVLWEGDYGRYEAEILPAGRIGEPGDIAGAVAFLLSDDASWITGSFLAVDGGRLVTSLVHSPESH